MRWKRDVARIEEMRNAFRISVVSLKKRENLRDLGSIRVE
jgi:hypothetical protein